MQAVYTIHTLEGWCRSFISSPERTRDQVRLQSMSRGPISVSVKVQKKVQNGNQSTGDQES
jgi:hypothetical protein